MFHGIPEVHTDSYGFHGLVSVMVYFSVNFEISFLLNLQI